MKILFLTTILLSRNRNGGEVASQCFIDVLREGNHEVQVVGYLRRGDAFEHNPQDTVVVDERYTETSKNKIYPLIWFFLSLLLNLPYSAAKYYSRRYKKIVREFLTKDNYDLVIIDHSQLSWLAKSLNSQTNFIFIAHNVEHENYQENSDHASNLIAKFIYKREANLMAQQENKLAIQARQVWTLTNYDAEYFAQLKSPQKSKVFSLPPGKGKLQDQPLKKQYDIGLLGSWSWQANREALQWFFAEIYPLLSPEFSLYIAGKGAEWLKEKYPQVNYLGVVPDAQEFMAQAKVIAIPTLSGGGIQIKTLDALASGSLIVATTVALRGINQPPATVRIAESPGEFAQYLKTAVTSPTLEEAFAESRSWYYQRQQQFSQELLKAVRE